MCNLIEAIVDVDDADKRDRRLEAWELNTWCPRVISVTWYSFFLEPRLNLSLHLNAKLTELAVVASQRCRPY
jgi:hypothetical protein